MSDSQASTRVDHANSVHSRRGVLEGLTTIGAFGVLGNTTAIAAPSPVASGDAKAITPDQALQDIMAGNARFVAGAPVAHTRDLAIIRVKAAEGQWPIAGVLSCADSRVPVEMVFDEPIGRLFVTRVAGNITTPEIIASLEYAVAVLGIKAIVVMGHSSCGAVKAAMDNPDVPGQISALFPAILPAIYMSKSRDPLAVTRQNAVVQAATLINSSTVIEAGLNAGTLKVVPALYDVATSRVEILPIPPSFRQTESK
jgi:carbonic anhydrase